MRVVEGPAEGIHEFDCSTGWPEPHERFDLIIAVESYAERDTLERRRWLQHAAATLAPDGWFAAQAPHDGRSDVDFWMLEEELGGCFPHVFMLARLPWHGVSLTPVLDDEHGSPRLELDESLVAEPPDASHYLALATQERPSDETRAWVMERCLLVPSAVSVSTASQSEIESLRDAAKDAAERADVHAERVSVLERALERERARRSEETARLQRQHASDRKQALERARAADGAAHRKKVEGLQQDHAAAREQGRKAQTDLSILTRSVRDLEAAIARANDSSAQRQAELDARHEEVSALRTQVQSLEAERGSLSKQMEVAIAEREGTRKLSQRVEAELELARRRLGEHEAKLAERTEDASKLTTNLQVTRAELEHQRALLAQAHSREEVLSAEAAQTVEQGRMLAEVASDRDRLREEVGRRGQHVQRLEARLWESREELEKARLENVRVASEGERLRERAERAHQSEAKQAKELERLGAELHQLELQRAELQATVRAHQEELTRLRAETASRAGDSEEAATVRVELAEKTRELADARARVEAVEAREHEAAALLRRRELQLSAVGEEMERLRRSTEENAATASTLEGELDVKALEVEQLAAAISDLHAELETRRAALEASSAREGALQRDLEEARGAGEAIRRRLRERDQELEDITSANESSGVELYKLRRELESAAEANEQLEQALDDSWPAEVSEVPTNGRDWPMDAVEAMRRLKAQLAAQSRRHAEQLATQGSPEGTSDTRLERLRIEARVRAEEQEHMLRELDGAEQRIWEMTDAADRNAARLAASLAQLEKNREELDDTRDELEVARKLLAAAEARALEQERLLASERARLARIGGGTPQGARGSAAEASIDEVDDLFADLAEEGAKPMIELGGGDEGAPVRHLRPDSAPTAGVPSVVAESNSSKRLLDEDAPRAPRMVVEPLDEPADDDPWESGVVSAPDAAPAGVRPLAPKKA